MKTNQQLERLIQWSLILILAVMPFHAFLSVWAAHLFGHQAVFQAWKEMVLVGLSGATAVLLYIDPPRRERLKQPWIYTVGALLAVALLVTILTRPSLGAVIYGLKTDFEFLVAGLIATIVASKAWLKTIIKTALIAAAIVCAYDVLQIFVLPPDLLVSFGYGPDTIAPFQRIAEGSTALRFPATLGGPNQLGTYLILPLCLALVQLRKRALRPWLVLLIIAIIISLFATHSRGAWLGALLAVAITIFISLPRRARYPFIIAGIVTASLVVLALPAALSQGGQLQYLLLHSSVENHDQTDLSDTQHELSLRSGLQALTNTPLGHGLGTAGPATFHVGETNIIESYYLQLGYELGILGLILFIAMIVLIVLRLWTHSPSPLQVATLAAILGISLVSVVLPAWTDSSTALIVWICTGAAVGTLPRTRHV